MPSPSRTVKVRFDGDTTGLAVAAKRGERIVDDFGDNSARSFTSRFKSWITGQGGDGLFNAGKSGGTIFGSGLAGALATPVLGPVLLGVLLAVVATIAPVIGGALAAGIVLAFGAGIAGLGIAFAAQSEQVKSAFTDLKNSIVPQMQEISVPFEATLVAIAGFMERTFDAFKPALEEAFAALAPVITQFSDQFFVAIEELIPAITPLTEAFAAMLEQLGPELPDLMAGIADAITDIAQIIEDNPGAFAALIAFLFQVAEFAIRFIGALAAVWSWLNKVYKVAEESGALGRLGAAIRIVTAPARAMLAVLQSIVSAIQFIAGNEVQRDSSGNAITRQSLGMGTFAGGAPRGAAVPFNRSTRALGGPVMAGRSYLVGERGPEILTMGAQSGDITPSHELGAGGGWDARGVARAVGDAINGATLIIDDRGVGTLLARRADLYGRAG